MGRIRRRADNGAGKAIVGIIVLTFVVFMSVQIANLYEKNQVYATRQEELESSLEDATETQRQLKEYEEYTKTLGYVEDIAKSKLGMVRPGDIVFKEKE